MRDAEAALRRKLKLERELELELVAADTVVVRVAGGCRVDGELLFTWTPNGGLQSSDDWTPVLEFTDEEQAAITKACSALLAEQKAKGAPPGGKRP